MRALLARDPLLALTSLLSALAGGALGVTGEITPLALAIPVVAAAALLRPAQAPRGRGFELAFQILSLGFLVYFAACVAQGRILAGAAALTFPVQAHSLLGHLTHRGLRRLHVLSFFQLLALASSTTELVFGPVLVLHLVLSPLILTLAALERGQGEPRVAIAWPRGFFRPALAASGCCLALGTALFLALPRYEVGLLHALAQPGQRIAGFSDRVTLGDITSIQTSDRIVLRARVDGGREGLLGIGRHGLRWRGKAFDAFDGREWTVSSRLRGAPIAGDAAIVGVPVAPGDPAARLRRVRQEISVEPLRLRALFALSGARVLSVSPETFQGVLVDEWGNLARTGEGARRQRYRVESEVGPDARELSEAEREAFLALPLLDARIATLARELAGDGDAVSQASRVESALQRDWTYSLDVNDRGATDPIARFLIEKAPGHCEYFASGMVVLLRSQGIPARLVTGFQQGEWSRLFRNHVVRQRDAHAWVEAWVPGQGWTVFDPTPMEGRETGRAGSGLDAWERLEMLWDDNVIGFNLTSQVSLLLTLRDAIVDAVRAVTRSAVATGLLLALLAIGVASVLLRLRHRRRGRPAAAIPAGAGTAFYARAQRLLARRGYRRGSGQTPLEVAERAAREGGDAGEAAVALTRAYYAARFGLQSPDPASVRALLARLERLAPRRR